MTGAALTTRHVSTTFIPDGVADRRSRCGQADSTIRSSEELQGRAWVFSGIAIPKFLPRMTWIVATLRGKGDAAKPAALSAGLFFLSWEPALFGQIGGRGVSAITEHFPRPA
jgi:hypothetical protein